MKNERFGRLVASLSPVGILCLDEELRCVFVNKRWSEIAGIAVKNAGADCKCLGVHPDDHARVQDLWGRLVGTGEPYRTEYRVLRPDGQTRWVLGEGAVLADDDGKAIGYVGSMTDITDRKAAEDELALHARITRHMAEGVMLVRARDASIVYTNPKFDEMFGYEAGEAVGRHVSAINAPSDKTPQAIAAMIIAELDRCGRWSGDVKNITKDGRAFWCRTSVSVFSHPGHGPVWLSIKTDITEAMAIKERLEASEEMLRNVLDTIPVRVFWKDVDSRYMGCNIAFARDAGMEYPAELVGDDDFSMSWKSEAERYRADDREVMATGVPKIDFEEPQTRPDGTALVLRTSKTPLRNRDGRVVGVLGVYEDITEYKRMMEELSRAQKLDSISLLAGGIAHDFNNLLTAVMGNVSLAMDLTDKHGDAFHALSAARSAAFKARDLAKQLLTLSKGGAPTRKAVDAGEFLRESTRLALRGSNVACSFDMQSDVCNLDIDEGLMGQVMHNLIINARQAMPGGGTIAISAEQLVLSPDNRFGLSAGGYVKVIVKDDGHGIAAENIKRIFDPYFTTKDEGTGLGLAICQSIMQKHGGRIDVESREGDGAKFTLYIPAGGAVVSRGPAEPLPISGHGKVLVMDDEAAICDLVSATLTNLGYEVDVASDGAKAVKMYSEALAGGKPYTVVLMDLTVPGGMGGKEAVREVLKLNPAAVVVASSGYSADVAMSDFKKYGFKGYVEKPYTTAELSVAISEALKGK